MRIRKTFDNLTFDELLLNVSHTVLIFSRDEIIEYLYMYIIFNYAVSYFRETKLKRKINNTINYYYDIRI